MKEYLLEKEHEYMKHIPTVTDLVKEILQVQTYFQQTD